MSCFCAFCEGRLRFLSQVVNPLEAILEKLEKRATAGSLLAYRERTYPVFRKIKEFYKARLARIIATGRQMSESLSSGRKA